MHSGSSPLFAALQLTGPVPGVKSLRCSTILRRDGGIAGH